MDKSPAEHTALRGFCRFRRVSFREKTNTGASADAPVSENFNVFSLKMAYSLLS